LLEANAAKVGVSPLLHGILTSAPFVKRKLQKATLYCFAA